MHQSVNKGELNKLTSQINKNKQYIEEIAKEKNDDANYSKALSMSVLIEYCSLSQREAYNALTDGSQDYGIDAFYYDSELDKEGYSHLSIVQSKYKQNDGSAGAFKEKDIKACIQACEKILAGKDLKNSNDILQDKITKYKDKLNNLDSPPIKLSLFFATNGLIHKDFKQLDEVEYLRKNGHNIIFVDASQYGKPKETKEERLLVSLTNDEDETNKIFKYDQNRGGIYSCSLWDLMTYYQKAGEGALLNQNVRFNLKKSLINSEIQKSFLENPELFCFLHNGITLTCSEFKKEHTGNKQTGIKIQNPSIVNGGQTISTLYPLFNNENYKKNFEQAYIIIRIFKVSDDLILKIAKATNSQNPINLIDLVANDDPQIKLKNFFAKQGIALLTKKGEDRGYCSEEITNVSLLQIYTALYKDNPSMAKVSKMGVFKTYYNEVFNSDIEKKFNELLRCFEINLFLSKKKREDEALISNAWFAIMYAMKTINPNLHNAKIPFNNSEPEQIFQKALKVIRSIIDSQQQELRAKFSYGNLFKNKKIKTLIDNELKDNNQ